MEFSPQKVDLFDPMLLIMENIRDIYQLEHADDPLFALKEHLFDRSNYISLFVNAKAISAVEDITYIELRSFLFAQVIPKLIYKQYIRHLQDESEVPLSRIQKFFLAVKAKQDGNDKGQNIDSLCDKFGLEWDSVKNFKRNDDYEVMYGIVRSKTNKADRMTYVFRDPSKLFYGKIDPKVAIIDEMIDNRDQLEKKHEQDHKDFLSKYDE